MQTFSFDSDYVIVVGSGPAAYSACLYLDSPILMLEGKIIGGIGPGGQLTTTDSIENYPGYNGSALELVKSMKNHVQKNKCILIKRETVVEIRKQGEKRFTAITEEGEYKSDNIILATGARARRLYVPGTNNGEFWNKGITACAVCDGFLFRDKIVAVIGGGDSAVEDTLYLSKIAKEVHLIHRRNKFRAKNKLLQKVHSLPNVIFHTPYALEKAEGTKFLESLTLKNTETAETKQLMVQGLFFAVGHIPNTQFLEHSNECNRITTNELKIDEQGFVITNSQQETSVPGIYACGDLQDKIYKQAITAAASGALAALHCNKNKKNK